MRVKAAVATVQGKAYYQIVGALKQKRVPFLSMIPSEPLPAEIRVVLTTEGEKHLINHERILVYSGEAEPELIASEARKILQGKDAYDNVVIGVDPGKAFGLAVVADGAVLDAENEFSVQAVLGKVQSVLRTVGVSSRQVTVKVGNGVPVYKTLVEELNGVMPPQVALEVVREEGTTHHCAVRHGRRMRHIASAICIASRTGRYVQRRKNSGQDN
ncbi:MAG: hypothetical protein NWF04_07440 [Candidatus Bathyarchaeota archaeon]|nr:hypothetical protein [Candidatus Bathyarchaeota archaeon]